MKKIIISLFLLFVVKNIFSQDFTRIIEVRNNRMNGPDILRLQTQLKKYGFDGIGEIDGYYGPLSETIIKKIQYFSGFEQNGKVDKDLWDFLFNGSNKSLMEEINIVSKYDINELTMESNSRGGYSTIGGEVNKYYRNNEIKMIWLHLAGETYQVNYHLYYIKSDYYFIINEHYRYPFPIYYLLLDPNKLDADELKRHEYELEVIAKNEFWTKSKIEYNVYLKNDNSIFQIINGKLNKTDFNLDHLINIIEGNEVE
jgi:hypothetical protein